MKFDKADAARALKQEQAVRGLVTQIEKASTELAEIMPELFRTNAAYGVFRRLGSAAEAQATFLAAAVAGMQRCNELPVDVFGGATEDPQDVLERVKLQVDDASAQMISAKVALQTASEEFEEIQADPWEWRVEAPQPTLWNSL